MRKYLFCAIAFLISAISFAQSNAPTDYLSKEFHKQRRAALRNLIPENSVVAIFSYPERTFSNDITYPFHQNPDLYYFTGYKEPDAMLLVFKDPQVIDGKTFDEVFFVREKDSLQEQWTGRRLGTEGVISELAIQNCFNGRELKQFPLDFSKFSKIILDILPNDLSNDPDNDADLSDLVKELKSKIGMQAGTYTAAVTKDLRDIAASRQPKRLLPFLKPRFESNTEYKENTLMKELMESRDSISFSNALQKIISSLFDFTSYKKITTGLREIKQPEEIALLRKAANISAEGHKAVMRNITSRYSELEIQGLQEYTYKKMGAECLAYPPAIGAGSNSCILHYEENIRPQVGNNLVLMDMGAEYHGYAADITRTIPATGKFTPEQKAIYEIVYQAQEAVFLLCKEGVPFPDLDKKAAEIIGQGLLKLAIIKDITDTRMYYPHSCSHFLGLDVHDKGASLLLKENMVITVEPGIYIPENSPCDKKWWNIGVRIEDDILVGKTSGENLSKNVPRTIADIERLMQKR